MNIIRLIYTSCPNLSLENTSKDLGIRDILASAHKNNPKLGITGALLVTKKHFLQVLEGPTEGVETLSKKIARDNRHSDFRTVAKTKVSERKFQDWSMAHINANPLELDVFDCMLSDVFSLSGERLDDICNQMSKSATDNSAISVKHLFDPAMG